MYLKLNSIIVLTFLKVPLNRSCCRGQLESRSNYKNGKLNGLYESWLLYGQLFERKTYKDGKLDGLCETWYDNGQIESRTNHKDNVSAMSSGGINKTKI